MYIKNYILGIEEVKRGIIANIDWCLNRKGEKIDTDKVYEQLLEMNGVPFNIQLTDGIVLENNITKAKDKDCYLLESRIFDDGNGGQMIDAYL